MPKALKTAAFALSLTLAFSAFTLPSWASDGLPDGVPEGYVAVEDENGDVYYEDGNRDPNRPMLRFDVIENRFKIISSVLYIRRWNVTQGEWVDPDWVRADTIPY